MICKNSIKGGPSTARIFDTLKDNEMLRVLDLSYNLLGQGGGSELITSICDFLRTNKNLWHLDLSVNNFSHQDCVLISESLRLLIIILIQKDESVDSRVPFPRKLRVR
jgi:Ran GTPase-activating protein (RanGAP) involved in mRNA processing and transport